MQCLHPQCLCRAASVNSLLRSCCLQENLWLCIIQQQWHLEDGASVSCGKSTGWRGICCLFCMHPERRPLLGNPDFRVDHNRMSQTAQRFLDGLHDGFMPAVDGCFTYHCAGATPIHYRYSDQRWMWSPDRSNWFDTGSKDISRGPFGSGGWKLVDDNDDLVTYLHHKPFAPFFNREVLVRRPAAIASFYASNEKLIEDFMAAVEALPPTTACIACDCFTVHFYMLPALQFSCTPQGWQISAHSQEAILAGEATEWKDLLQRLHDMHSRVSPSLLHMQRLIVSATSGS